MRKFLFGLAICAFFVSCSKDGDMEKATVIDAGDIAAGGCGYILELTESKSQLRPLYLDSKYRHNGYKVKVKYNTRDEYGFCTGGWPDTSRTYIMIEIAEIKTDLD